MLKLRHLLRGICYTHNTIRYRIEGARLMEAWAHIPQPIGTLFDGGAGSGEFCKRLLTKGLCQNVVALEYDPMNFAFLKDNLGGDRRAKLIQGSVLDVPLEDESVDAVMSTQVIEHIEDHERAASEFNRVLKPGGYAVISTPHPPEPFPNDGHIREGYTQEDLTNLFAPWNWKPLWTDYYLTKDTTSRMVQVSSYPAHGVFVPVALVDRERNLSWEERRDRLPFGILMVFQKPAR